MFGKGLSSCFAPQTSVGPAKQIVSGPWARSVDVSAFEHHCVVFGLKARAFASMLSHM